MIHKIMNAQHSVSYNSERLHETTVLKTQVWTISF